MLKLHPASLVLLPVLLFSGCGRSEPSAPRAAAGITEGQPAPKQTAATTMTPSADAAPGVNAQGAATLEFQKRIQAYLKIHNDAQGKVPNLKKTDDPKEISDREKALAEAIMTLRAGAKPGEVFAPEYQPYFIKIVQDDFKTRSAVDRKAIVVELPKSMKVDINTIYPTTIPLATFPPMLLRKLPDLPPELEYRLVGHSLILRDVQANLIVDVLRDVVATIPS